MTDPARGILLAVLAALVISCRPGSNPAAVKLEGMSFANSEWSSPIYLGTVLNTPFRELNPGLSPDELSLYVGSDRPGGLGGIDIWVSRRGCVECPWEPPVNLGAPVNSPSTDGVPVISGDGHLLFFESNRPGGAGKGDIYVSRRADPNDDFGWGPPVNLGADLNTPDIDTPGAYVQGNLYFSRGPDVASFDIYQAPVTANGETRGPAVIIPELSDPSAIDGNPTVRADGREIIFWSNRTGGMGANDLWVSDRPSVHDPWSTPRNLGVSVNTAFAELTPTLSRDGRTLIFSSTRPGGLGFQDLWMSTRTVTGDVGEGTDGVPLDDEGP
jgi:WD40 repeat protein